MTYLAITTCNAEQWAKYGRAMARTFCRYWPREIPLRIYAEGFSYIGTGGIEVESLDLAAPWLAPWKAARTKAERGYRTGRYRFRDDAVRFSHKIAAISAAAGSADSDVLIWMDADIVTHAPVTVGWLEELFPPPADIAWLERERIYPECGFLMFRLPSARGVIRTLRNVYKTGEIFRYSEWHDSFVIQKVVNRACNEITVLSLSGDGRKSHHPLVNSRVAECLDHLKGSRKAEGRSRPSDLVKPRPEPYWQSPAPQSVADEEDENGEYQSFKRWAREAVDS